jgi:hypothetical protein
MGERFRSFPHGGRLGWGSLSYQKKLYDLTVSFIVKNYIYDGKYYNQDVPLFINNE